MNQELLLRSLLKRLMLLNVEEREDEQQQHDQAELCQECARLISAA